MLSGDSKLLETAGPESRGYGPALRNLAEAQSCLGAPAEALETALRSASELRAAPAPPIVRTVATRAEGVEALREVLDARATGDGAADLALRRRGRARARIRAAVDRRRASAFWGVCETVLEELVADVVAGRLAPGQAVARLMENEGQ